MNYQHYLDIAAECAEFSTYTGPNPVQLGCIAVYHGTILAKGSNSDKTHTRQAKYNYLRYSAQTAHYYPAYQLESSIWTLISPRLPSLSTASIKMELPRLRARAYRAKKQSATCELGGQFTPLMMAMRLKNLFIAKNKIIKTVIAFSSLL